MRASLNKPTQLLLADGAQLLDAELLQRVVLDLGCKIRRKGFLFGVGQVLQIWYI